MQPKRSSTAEGSRRSPWADRDLSGLSLKRIYQLYPGKEELRVAVLQRRDERWRARLATYVDQFDDPRRRILPRSIGYTAGFRKQTSGDALGSTRSASWAQNSPTVASATSRGFSGPVAWHCRTCRSPPARAGVRLSQRYGGSPPRVSSGASPLSRQARAALPRARC